MLANNEPLHIEPANHFDKVIEVAAVPGHNSPYGPTTDVQEVSRESSGGWWLVPFREPSKCDFSRDLPQKTLTTLLPRLKEKQQRVS